LFFFIETFFSKFKKLNFEMTWIADVQIANVHGSDRPYEEDVEEAHQEDHPAEHHAL
jgi:hypothetical protein